MQGTPSTRCWCLLLLLNILNSTIHFFNDTNKRKSIMQYLYKLRIDKHKHTHKIILFLNLETRFKARLSWIQSFGVRTKFPGVKRNELPEPRPALRWPPHVPGPLCARAGPARSVHSPSGTRSRSRECLRRLRSSEGGERPSPTGATFDEKSYR